MKKISTIFILAFLKTAMAMAYYGSGAGSDGLSNLQLGAKYGYQASYRFRAHNSQYLSSIRPYIIFTTKKPGYSSGTGGTVVVRLESDNGSGFPSGTVLASATLTQPLTHGSFPQIKLLPQVKLVAGSVYHLVFSNSDPDPSVNYVSVDCLYNKLPTSPMQPTEANSDSAVLQYYTGGSWSLIQDLSPIIEVDYANGSSEGKWGYIDTFVDFPQPISGSAMARETFNVSGANQSVSGASVRLAHISGTGSLTISLQNSSGAVIDQGTVPYSAFSSTNSVWVSVNFSSSHVLTVGQGYNLVLTAPSNTVYQIYPLEKGSPYGYQATTYFGDGHAQFTTGSSGWLGWTFSTVGNSSDTDSDLQFYFTNSANSSSYSNVVLNDSPVLFWQLNETSSQVSDSSPHGNSGTASGVSFGMPSLLQGSSVMSSGFNGSSSYASSGIGEINTYSGISVEIFFKASGAISGIETLFLLGTQNTTAGYHWLYLRNNGTLCWQYANGSSFQTQCTSFTPSAGTIYDVAVTHDYTGKKLIFFINGTSYETMTLTDTALPLVIQPVTVGAYRGSEDFFNGNLGDAAIYNYVLSPAQILKHWNAR